MAQNAKPLQVRLEEKLRDLLDSRAEELELSAADVTRRALTAYLLEPCPKCTGTGVRPRKRS